MADSQAVYGYIVVEQSLKSVGIRAAVKLRPVKTIGDQKDDLAAAGSAIMKQLSGGMHGIVKGFSWAGPKVSRRCLGRFAHAERMARRRGNEGDWAGGRRPAVVLSVLQFGPQLIEIAGESLAWLERQVEAADEGFVAGTDSGSDGAQTGGHLCGVI